MKNSISEVARNITAMAAAPPTVANPVHNLVLRSRRLVCLWTAIPTDARLTSSGWDWSFPTCSSGPTGRCTASQKALQSLEWGESVRVNQSQIFAAKSTREGHSGAYCAHALDQCELTDREVSVRWGKMLPVVVITSIFVCGCMLRRIKDA